MKEILATITQRGQVTVPAEVRRLLGAKTGDKLAFQIDGTEVRLAPAAMTLESAFASVMPHTQPEDFAHVEEIAKEEHVARTLAKMHDR
jgi:antitoxin PrlF